MLNARKPVAFNLLFTVGRLREPATITIVMLLQTRFLDCSEQTKPLIHRRYPNKKRPVEEDHYFDGMQPLPSVVDVIKRMDNQSPPALRTVCWKPTLCQNGSRNACWPRPSTQPQSPEASMSR